MQNWAVKPEIRWTTQKPKKNPKSFGVPDTLVFRAQIAVLEKVSRQAGSQLLIMYQPSDSGFIRSNFQASLDLIALTIGSHITVFGLQSSPRP